MSARYALYYAPATGSALANFGATVLGRTATTPRTPESSSTFADRSRWLALTRGAVHYGFHATLKAPFELQEGVTYQALATHTRDFAREHAAIKLRGLAPRQLAGFAALTLEHQSAALTGLAQQVVEQFEPYRRALTNADIERRLNQGLTPRQQNLLYRFGYPFVAEEFCFHMTLSGALSQTDRDYVEWLIERYETLVPEPPVLDRLALYAQQDRHSPFVEMLSCPLSPAAKYTD